MEPGKMDKVVDYIEHYEALITALAAVFTFLATAFIAHFTRTLRTSTDKLWSETKAATSAAQKSADAAIGAERAWLLPTVECDNFKNAIERAKVFGLGEQGVPTDDPPKVCFRFKNYGKTPAFVKEISFDLKQMAEFSKEALHYVPDTTFTRNNIIASTDTVPLGDRGPFEKTLDVPFDCVAASSVEQGQSALWFFGRIVYDDVWGNEHFTTFCRTYRGLSNDFVPYGGKPYERT
jgi:hypothetical protein